jgi:hypothetical protein
LQSSADETAHLGDSATVRAEIDALAELCIRDSENSRCEARSDFFYKDDVTSRE